MGDFMKRILLIVLSVLCVGFVGCSKDTDSLEVAQSEEQVEIAESITTEMVTQEVTQAETVTEQKVTEITQEEKETPEDAVSEEKDKEQTEKKQETPNEEVKSEEPKTEAEKKPEPKKEEPKKETPKKEEPKKEEPKEEKAVGYSADKVVSLVVSKCEAGGMITTEHNLDRLLADGSITKEDYDDCYPLDGLENSYYSVFVNVDLNKASTTSGRALRSEGEIADYIAGMLLLESDSIFNIRNAGVTKNGGESFYEFRCYR
jgi:hypothetical protein